MNDLTLLNLSNTMRADYESSVPTGISMSDIEGMEQFLIGVRTHSGQKVTPEKARRCAVVLAIMRGLADDISSLPLGCYQHTKNGDEPAFDHNGYTLLNSAPNEIMTPIEVREHLMYDLMLRGSFYFLKTEDPDSPGDIESLWPLQADYVTRRWRQLVWDYTDPITGVSGSFTPDLVWRGTIMSGNGLDGTAITLLCREAIGLALAAEEQAGRLFSHGVQTDLQLVTTDQLDEPTKQQLREAFMKRHAGSNNAWMPLLMEGGLEAKRIGLTAQESQYMEARSFQIEEIARVFRYPEVLLGTSGKSKSSTYASAEQFFDSYTKHTLGPWATRIEQTANRDLLLGRDRKKYFFKHDFSSLLRGDTAARYASYTAGILAGFMSPAQARRAENMPYVPGLDYFTRPLNSTTTAGQDAASVAPTDESAKALHSVAFHILRKEQSALVGQKKDSEQFYPAFASYLADLTGAPAAAIQAYLEMRRATSERFTTEAQGAAVAALISLCTKGQFTWTPNSESHTSKAA